MSALADALQAQSARRTDTMPWVESETRDPRGFYLTQDYRNHQVTLRFLPGLPDAYPDYRILYRHRVRYNGWTYQDEICRNGCPVCAYEARTGRPLGKRRLKLLMNVLIEKDTCCKENIGEVKLYECGEQIAKLIDTQLTKVKANIFDPKTGNSFRLQGVWSKDGSWNYRNGCGFFNPSPVMNAGLVLSHRHDLMNYPFRDDADIQNSFQRLRLPVV